MAVGVSSEICACCCRYAQSALLTPIVVTQVSPVRRVAVHRETATDRVHGLGIATRVACAIMEEQRECLCVMRAPARDPASSAHRSVPSQTNVGSGPDTACRSGVCLRTLEYERRVLRTSGERRTVTGAATRARAARLPRKGRPVPEEERVALVAERRVRWRGVDAVGAAMEQAATTLATRPPRALPRANALPQPYRARCDHGGFVGNRVAPSGGTVCSRWYPLG